MKYDPDPPDEHDGQSRDEKPPESAPVELGSAVRGLIPSLDAFASTQRRLAGIELFAIRAAQCVIDQAAAFDKIAETQNSIVQHFARSLDFSRIAAIHKSIGEVTVRSSAMSSQAQWAEALANSISFPALGRALASIDALDSWARPRALSKATLGDHADLLAGITKRAMLTLPGIDVPGLLAGIDRWLPVNLRSVVAVEVVATISLDEGIPLSWVPRTEIVLLLIEADNLDMRLRILTDHRGEILDDCEEVLTPIQHEWAVQCRSAIAAMRAGLDGPAQSHASNTIDSIVLALYGRNGREQAKNRARTDFDDLPLQLAAENLTLRPLFRAFAVWYPNTGNDPPIHFARHATSHAVGHAGVFAPTSALIAVMLTTSLIAQYARHDYYGAAATPAAIG